MDPPPSATMQVAPLARQAVTAASVTSTGVCMAAPAKTPADIVPKVRASALAPAA